MQKETIYPGGKWVAVNKIKKTINTKVLIVFINEGGKG